MEKYPKTNKPIEQKSEADPKKINAAKAAFKWLKDNWKKSTILGVGAMMAAPSIAQNEADVNKQVGEEIASSEKNKNSYTIAGGHVLEKKQKKGEIKEDYQATVEDFKKTKETKKERVKPQEEIDLIWPSLDPELVEEYGIYYGEDGRVYNSDGKIYKGEYGQPFIGGTKKQEVENVMPKPEENVNSVKNTNKKQVKQNNPINNKGPKLKPGYKFGPNGFIVDSEGNPAKENPFVGK